jgi:hypothetical protein
MVACSVPRLGFVPQVNLARLYLFRAADALDAGHVFEAGVLLREAVRRQLFAECNWKGCLPAKEAKRRSSMALLHALKAAGHCGYVGFQWTRDIIETANKCAHCVPVQPRLVLDCILIWHEAIDHDPCGEPTDRQMKVHPTHPLLSSNDCGCDDDDHDSADWWKEGGEV